ncbi:MAG: nucleotidyl transferase AbiEii/AbiGii toxin family protein [Verrucomicrobia bacterium]|nr:nucleotidyl transferase AbiEii/AbiGii toxin family protein [Verrucomicrobiota bacterium]MCH8528010.1 nucleotidyl transferase AbiEii/AbiGii toxin family protein [Kiritimatiellia bacterium]
MKNLSASIKQRLLNHARAEGLQFDEVLKNFGIERVLYRLSISEHASRFVLKGAQIFRVWGGNDFRPTRDVDLLGYTSNRLENLTQIIHSLFIEPAEDGLRLDPTTLQAERIKEDADYQGVRITFHIYLDRARIPIQIDIGFDDIVTPEPEEISFPSMLGFPEARLRGYTPQTVIAEKLEAMVLLGERNSRMKDFYDILLLSRTQQFSFEMLCAAVRRTFHHRNQVFPVGFPVLLNPDHPAIPAKQIQWAAFLRKNQIANVPEDFKQVCGELERFLAPVLQPGQQTANRQWIPAEGWIPYHETIAFEGQPASE